MKTMTRSWRRKCKKKNLIKQKMKMTYISFVGLTHDVLSSPSFNWFLSGCWVIASNFIVMERNRFKWTWWRDAVRQRCHLKLEASAHDVHSSIQHENGSFSVVGRAHDANINMSGHLFWTNAAPVEEIYITHRNYIWLLSFAYAITVIISFYLPSCFDDVVVVSGGRPFSIINIYDIIRCYCFAYDSRSNGILDDAFVRPLWIWLACTAVHICKSSSTFHIPMYVLLAHRIGICWLLCLIYIGKTRPN